MPPHSRLTGSWWCGRTPRSIGSWASSEIPVTWVSRIPADGILTILGVLLANRIWSRLSARSGEPVDLHKMAIGCAMVAAAFVLVGLLATMPKVPVVGWLAFYLVLTMSYALAMIRRPRR